MRKLIPGRGLLVLLGALFVSGCAIPVPIQVASWALDGISYLATQKSVTDHGISFVAQQDCALWRTVQGKDICDSYDAAGTVAVAALDPVSSPSESAIIAQGTEIPENITASTEIIAFDTASGDVQTPVAINESDAALPSARIVEVDQAPIVKTERSVPKALPIGDAVAIEMEPVAVKASLEPVVAAVKPVAVSVDEPSPLIVVEPGPANPVQIAALMPEQSENSAASVPSPNGDRVLIPGQRIWSDAVDANIYYVIGSFQNRANAKRLVKRHMDLGPSVMATRVKGVEMYRVAVGPFTRVEQRSVRRTIRKTGIRKSWAISIDPSQWMIAGPTVPVKAPVASSKPAVEKTASLPGNLNQNEINISQYIDKKEQIAGVHSQESPFVGASGDAGQNTIHVVARLGQRVHAMGNERSQVGQS